MEKTSQEINTVASFEGAKVTVSTGGKAANVVIDGPFILDGNFFMNSMLEKKFSKGSIVEARMYDPSFEIEDTIRVRVQVMGVETVDIDGKERSLLHIKQIIENFKNIDIYLDENGITQKARILMLNNVIELVIKG